MTSADTPPDPHLAARDFEFDAISSSLMAMISSPNETNHASMRCGMWRKR